jgi:hypothetical protein
MKQRIIFFFLFFLILILSVLSCKKVAKNYSIEKAVGYWGAEIVNGDDKQEFVFIFEIKDDELIGNAHSYFNGIKYPPLQLSEIKFLPPKLSFIAQTSQSTRFEGTVDTIKGKIEGALHYENGSEQILLLHKLSTKNVSEKYRAIKIKKLHYQYLQPIKEHDGIATAIPSEVGLHDEIFTEMMNAVYKGEYGLLNSILVFKDNKLVLEEYLNGFGKNDLYPIQSCTKSVAALLIGIAIDQGKISDLNKPIIEHLGDYKDKESKDWEKISLSNILTMSSGLDWTDGYDSEINTKSENIIADVLKRKVKTQPGAKFEYISPNVSVLAVLLKNTTSMHADKFAEEFLFKPIGITAYRWDVLNQNGYPLMSGTLALRSRDMLKIGTLVLNDGKWMDKQIISTKWINEIKSIQIKTGEPFDYSYLWWVGKTKTSPAQNAILANGLGSQFIVIVPSINLVVITTGSNFQFENHLKPLQMIDKFIVQKCL